MSGRFCLDCGYDLRGAGANRCPECGREFDPADRFTFAPSPDWVDWGRWFRRFELGLNVAAAGVGGVMLLGYCGPLAGDFWQQWFGLFWTVAIYFGITCAVGRASARWLRIALPRPALPTWTFAAIFGAVFATLWFHGPTRVGFLLSRQDLDALADSLPPDGRCGRTTAGTYRIEQAVKSPDGSKVTVVISGMEGWSDPPPCFLRGSPAWGSHILLDGGWCSTSFLPGRECLSNLGWPFGDAVDALRGYLHKLDSGVDEVPDTAFSHSAGG